jgi:hypothetical protein
MAQRGVRRDAALAIDNPGNAVHRHPDLARQFSGRHAKFPQFLAEVFAGMDCRTSQVLLLNGNRPGGQSLAAEPPGQIIDLAARCGNFVAKTICCWGFMLQSYSGANVLNRRGLILAGLSVMIPSRLDAAAMIASWEGEKLVLTPGPAHALLRLSENMNGATLAAQARTRRIILRLGGIAANRDPQTGYLVFLNAREDVKPTADDIGYAGALSFFGMPKEVSEGSRAVSFEVSLVLLRLQQAGRLNGPVAVTFVPAASPAEGSRPSISEIALYAN